MRRKIGTICVMVMAVFLTASRGMGTVQLKDGQTYDIYWQIPDHVWVDYNAPGIATTVNFTDAGGVASGYDVRAFEDSIVNISGGSIGRNLYANDTSHVTVFGGSIGRDLYASGTSDVTVFGGSIRRDLYASGTTQITLSGGSIGYWITADGTALWAGGELILATQAILTIDGSDFAVDAQPFGYGEITSILRNLPRAEPPRRLTGILRSGDPIDNDFYIGNNARIVLVPEPATLSLLALGGLALLRRRRQQP